MHFYLLFLNTQKLWVNNNYFYYFIIISAFNISLYLLIDSNSIKSLVGFCILNYFWLLFGIITNYIFMQIQKKNKVFPSLIFVTFDETLGIIFSDKFNRQPNIIDYIASLVVYIFPFLCYFIFCKIV